MAAVSAEAGGLMRAQRRMIAGERLHLHDGPIDLIIGCDGAQHDRRAAYDAAWLRFVSILDELCAELPLLRRAVTPETPVPQGIVARRMRAAVQPFSRQHFITPMAAVAGAVAEEILGAMVVAGPRLRRAYVNNGGDIALHLADGAHYAVGMVDRPDWPSSTGIADIAAASSVRGLATSGWRGRSFSLGIADAVTVLAATAAQADAAATIIANAVDLPGDPRIIRVPASALDPQSDLGEKSVTRDVPLLPQADLAKALGSGAACAQALHARGLIISAALHMQGVTQVVEPDRFSPARETHTLEMSA